MPKDKYDLLYIIDPVSSMLLTFTLMISMTIMFTLSFSQFLVILGIDLLLFLIISVLDSKIFPLLFTQFSPHFPRIDAENITRMSEENKLHFVQTFLTFPALRTRWIFFLSVFKVIIPGILLVHFFSPGENVFFNWFRFWTLEVFYILLIFSGLAFTTISRHCYEVLAHLDSEADLSAAFGKVSIPKIRSELFMVENFTLFSSALAFIVLTWASAQGHLEAPQEFVWRLIGILISGFVSIGRVYFVNRRNFIAALRAVFARISSLEGGNDRFIPIHTDSTLANFERSFNLLIQRLKNRDREIETWMAFQAEQNKMANIGESVSLVTHDMVSPLHAIEFCVDELTDGELAKDERNDYLEQMKFNLHRVLEMVNSIKYSAKNPQGKEKESSLFDAYSYTIQLLKTHFSPKEMEAINFFYDPQLVAARFNISHTNLIHLLYNTMKNSVNNLILHQVPNPKVELMMFRADSQSTEFFIRDNGTGLSSFEFERMTSKESLIDTRKGLGMRLTKRIVEKYQGDMFVMPVPSQQGTEMHVTLPRSTHEER